MEERHGSLSSGDGLELTWRAWSPESPRAVVCFVHGLFEHGERYRDIAGFLFDRGYACYAVDLRGHGHSQGRRVHVQHFDDYCLDVEALLHLAEKTHPGLPKVLVGHSMGGVVAIRCALRFGDRIQGLALSAPGLAAHPDSTPPAWLAALGRLLSRLAPTFLVDAGLDASFVSRDPEVVAAYRGDSRIGRKVSARWFTAMTEAQADCFARAGSLQIPVFLMQAGADRLVSPEASARWAEAVHPELVSTRVWPQCAHELFNEPERLEVYTALSEWLDGQIPRR